MHELSLDPACRTERFRALRDTFPTHVEQIEAEQAVYYQWHREQRRRMRVSWLVRLWPVALGLVLSLIAVPLSGFLLRSHAWGMWLVFPFTLLAHRPELAVNEHLTRTLPRVVLLAQFPLEGLVALLAMRRRMTFPGVTGQIFYFHFLAAVQLAMLTGMLNPLLIH
jgi:hypothetical protein